MPAKLLPLLIVPVSVFVCSCASSSNDKPAASVSKAGTHPPTHGSPFAGTGITRRDTYGGFTTINPGGNSTVSRPDEFGGYTTTYSDGITNIPRDKYGRLRDLQ